MKNHACTIADLDNRTSQDSHALTPKGEDLRKMLRFRAWHRGTREMDLLIGSFADLHLPQFDEAELLIFQEILTHQDPDVYDWVIGRCAPPVELNSRVLELLCRHRFVRPCC